MAHLLDADWTINALAKKRQADTILRRLLPGGVLISWVTAAEVYEGAFGYSNPEAHLGIFRRFLRPVRKVGVNEAIIERFAEVRAFLRRRGELISDLDVFVAATALHQDLTVLTFNLRHFSRIPDLKLYRA